MAEGVDVSIVLPCYNPLNGWAERVVACYTAFEAYVGMEGRRCELIVVNDGSKVAVGEEDIEYIRSRVSNFRYLGYELNRGKGYALRHGVSHSCGRWIIYTDIDFPFTEASLEGLAGHLLADKADVAVAVRASTYYEKVPFARRVISKVLRFMIRWVFRMPITDTQAGLKGFNERGKAVFLSGTIDRYLFDLEFVYKASHERGVRVEGVWVQLNDGVVFSKMPLKVLMREASNFLTMLIRR
jgi:glycosyltransferase involved in cell wall biosynthesis